MLKLLDCLEFPIVPYKIVEIKCLFTRVAAPYRKHLNSLWLLGTKHFPESQNTCKNPKPIPKKQNHIQVCKMLPRFQNTVGFWEAFWILGSVLDSGECFWFLGHILDFGKCFGFWDVFFNSEKCYWIVGCVLDSGTCFVPTSHRMNLMISHKKGDCKK